MIRNSCAWLLWIYLLSISYISSASWRPEKLETCELHPDIEARIIKDVSFWANRGITESVATSVCRFCDINSPKARRAARSLSSTLRREHRAVHRSEASERTSPTDAQPGSHDQGAGLEVGRGSTDTGANGAAAAAGGLRADVPGATESDVTQTAGPTATSRGGPAGAAFVVTQAQGPQQQQQQQRRRLLQEENCNKPQRVLIENGTVYLTNLIAESWLGPFEHIGFLVELYEASQVFRLPDVEFTYWFGDNAPAHTVIGPDGSSKWPYTDEGAPAVISWSKWNENSALVVPYAGAFRCPQDSWDSIESQLETATGIPWAERQEVAFGRWNAFCTHYIPWMKTADGNVMKCPRTHLDALAAAHPDLLDTFELGHAKPVPLMHQNVHKYIVSTDGWSISSKFDKYLLLGSTILKAASTRYGFYYDAIKPYKHYLPFMVNTSDDILEAVTWAKSHDAEAQQIATEARRFALRNLNRRARLCYLFRLMTELSKVFRYRPTCRRRQLCVPLVQEIQLLERHPRTRKQCRYNEVLLRYGDDDPDGLPGADVAADRGDPLGWKPRGTTLSGAPYYSFEDLRRLHSSGIAWPRDDAEPVLR